MCKTRAGYDFLLLVPSLGFFQVMSQLRRSARLATRSQHLGSSLPVEIDLRTTCRRISLLSLTISLFLLPLPASSVMGTSPLLGHSLTASLLFSPHHLQCVTDLMHESSQSVVCPALSVPFLLGLPPLSALVLRSPRGGSCRRVHDLFLSSIFCLFFQCALLP